MANLSQYFESMGFSATQTMRIVQRFKKKVLEKDEYFVREGKIALELAFVESGQMQYYSMSNLGEERTTYICLENNFLASLLSYLNEVPSRENIRALVPTVLWVIDKADVQELLSTEIEFKDFYIRLIEWQICCIDKSRLDLITLTAEQRYLKLLKEDPEILQKVPLQYIASILAITPRHLSRLRSKV